MIIKTRITLIHATPIAIDPIRDAMTRSWPDADVVNILEDSLSPDLDAAAGLTDQLTNRIIALVRYAESIGSHGILFTCSAFGAAIDQAARLSKVPVLKPNEAMFETAIRQGRSTAMLYTFPPSRKGMEQEFAEEADKVDPQAKLTSFLVEGAIEAIRAGDAETHNRLVAEKAASIGAFDTIVLAHFSTSRALNAVRATTRTPILTSPDAAVAKLQRLLVR